MQVLILLMLRYTKLHNKSNCIHVPMASREFTPYGVSYQMLVDDLLSKADTLKKEKS